jgi:hypothetical protein
VAHQMLFKMIDNEIQEKMTITFLNSMPLPQMEAFLLVHGASVKSLDPHCCFISLAEFVSRGYCISLFHLPGIMYMYSSQLATKRLKRESTLSHAATIRCTKIANQYHCVHWQEGLNYFLNRGYTGADTLLNAACLCFGRRRYAQAQDSSFHAGEWNQNNIFLPTVAVTLLLSQFIMHALRPLLRCRRWNFVQFCNLTGTHHRDMHKTGHSKYGGYEAISAVITQFLITISQVSLNWECLLDRWAMSNALYMRWCGCMMRWDAIFKFLGHQQSGNRKI